MASVAGAYLCRTTDQGRMEPGNEAILKCTPFSPQEITEGLVNGYLIHNGTKIPLRDGFLTFAFLQAYLRGHIKLDPVAKSQAGK